MEQNERIQREAEVLANIVRRKMGAKAGLRLVNARSVRREVPTAPAPSRYDAQSRDIIYSRIRDLARIYGLGLLIRQETAHCSSRIECLNDDELAALLRMMERARECVMEGTPIDEAGLLRAVMIDR